MSAGCANPLYLTWIREWWDAANANNAKDRLSYKAAWESIKTHPIAFTHPSEAIQLKGIGPKLVERLTERLDTHCRAEGLHMPKRPTKKRSRNRTTHDAEDEDEVLEASPPKRTRKTPKGYVPKPRSGAYALVLTLAELPEGQTIGLTKAELQHQAQPLADASFTVPSDPSKFHTAWNSMGTLESKHLVYTFGRPTKRYALTEEGWIIAKSMKESEQSGINNSATHSPQPNLSARLPLQSTNQSSNRGPIIIESDDDAVMADDFEARIRRKFGSKENFKTVMADSVFSSTHTLDDEALGLLREFAQRATNASSAVRSTSAPRASIDKRGISSTSQPRPLPSVSRPSDILTRVRSGTTSAASMRNQPSVSAPSVIGDIPPYQSIIVPPGSFTVELVLDTREVRAKTDRSYIQDELNKAGLRCQQRALQVGDMIWTAKIHDPDIISQLEPGDRKVPEIVLDYIVERKRLDDLDSSIKDKRFLEQKFRLKRSGIRNAIYIIEDYGSVQAMEDQQHTRLVTATAATQVIDGFFVKRTRKLDDTITYLANMTRLLKEKYERKPLSLIPSSVLTAQNHLVLRTPEPLTGDHGYVTYEALAGLVSKSATLTLRDVFLKMLMCTRGITGDKAIEIQKHWQTPSSLVEAFAALPTAAEKNDLIWRIAGSFQDKRKIGRSVSQTISEIWGSA